VKQIKSDCWKSNPQSLVVTFEEASFAVFFWWSALSYLPFSVSVGKARMDK